MTLTYPIKTLQCFGYFHKGGIENWLMNLLLEKRKEISFDFFVDTPGGCHEAEASKLGSRIFHNSRPSVFHKVGVLNRYEKLREVLRTHQYDVVHTHSKEMSGTIAKIAAQEGVPVRVVHSHNTCLARGKKGVMIELRKVRFRSINRKRVLKYATDIMACSSLAGHFFMGNHWNTDSRCRNLFCGVASQSFLDASLNVSRGNLRKKYNIPNDALVIGHAGSMASNQKNHTFILDTFHELYQRNGKYWLFLAGDGVLRGKIIEQAKQLDVDSRVIIPGNCEISELMVHGFDLHFLPSLFEGLPVVGLEAVASGLYTICSDTITDEFSGYFSDRVTTLSLQESVSAWADAIEDSFSKRIPVEKGCEILQKSPFSVNASYESMLAIYENRLSFN